MRHAIYIILGLLVPLLALGACGSAPRVDTVRLTSADLVAMTDRMAESLLSDRVVALRTVNDTPWIITLDRVINNTSDVITEGEKRAFLARVRSLLSQSTTLQSRNLQFVVPAETAATLQEPHFRVTPTHVLAATFYSGDTYSREARTATYLCTFQLMELATDRVLWEDWYELKRSVVRSEWD